MLDKIFLEAYASPEVIQKYQSLGYTEDMLPKGKNARTMNTLNYFTLWMGSIHNIPNYVAVGGFLLLGLSPINVILATIVSSLVLSFFMVFNGVPGSKYGIPFALHLRAVYGKLGAKLPGFLRGGVAAIAWFAIQNFTGALALQVIIGKMWPGFLTLGGDFNFFGANLSVLISFTIFWAVNVAMGFGGNKILNKFTAILNPLTYIVFGGMTIWALRGAGLSNILSYSVTPDVQRPVLLLGLIVINSIVAVWAAPGVSVADFTQHAKSTKTQAVGQTLSFVVGYGLFAFASVAILIGGNIIYNVGAGQEVWNIVDMINRWDSVALTIFASLVLLMTTISTNATGNIIPAGYQLAALFPKKLNYKKGVLVAALISYVMMPWKLMENADSIFLFLNAIGATLGPVAGVMLVDYYLVKKQKIDLNLLYMGNNEDDSKNPYRGVNINAYIATIIGLVLALSGLFIPRLEVLAELSWIISLVVSGLVYWILSKFVNTRRQV